MNEMQSDFELLRPFVRQGDQAAFGTLVRRHLDLVFGTALRKVDDPGAAEEIAQDVFGALARSGWQFAPDDSVPAWLHRTTILKAKQWLRGEFRRRRREQAAVELGTTMKNSDKQTALRALVPLLDEALLSLSEKDRAALLLRFYESRSLRDLGLSLGVGEDAAQKRVATALDRLSRFFERRGFKTATASVAAAALRHTAGAAPAGIANSVIQAALHSAPSAAAGLTPVLARLAGLTKTQTAFLCLVLAVTPIAWQWNQTHAAERKLAALQSSLNVARAQQEEAAAQTDRLRAESARLEASMASAPAQSPTANEEAARKLGALKTRLLGLLTGADYQWPDDLPFVRVPKWALKGIGSGVPAFGPNGTLAPWVQEVLNLSPDQKRAIQSNLAQYLGDLDRMAASRASVTNWASPDGSFHQAVTVPALGEDGRHIEDNLATNLITLAGPDGAKTVMSPLFSNNQWFGPERVSHSLIGESQQFSFSVKPRDSGSPDFTTAWEGHLGSEGHVPEGSLPPFLMDSYQPWLQQIGITNSVLCRPTP